MILYNTCGLLPLLFINKCSLKTLTNLVLIDVDSALLKDTRHARNEGNNWQILHILNFVTYKYGINLLLMHRVSRKVMTF